MTHSTLFVQQLHSPKSNRKTVESNSKRIEPIQMKTSRRKASATPNMRSNCISARILFAALLLLCSGRTSVEASITVVGTQQSFPSEPVKGVGRHMWKGYEYIGRLQYLPHHMDLCDIQEPVSIIVPQDSVPGRSWSLCCVVLTGQYEGWPVS